ncbi:MAG TPA: T9SS type A sorting domain-containing protein, partial [Flavobacteriaceae bacterium]|nr:T9SS type A sorting domain-containing protein [Flavobacteriaceae bacterium]
STIERVNVYDVRGRVVASHGSVGTPRYVLDISGLTAAMYFVEVTTPEGKATRRVVRE